MLGWVHKVLGGRPWERELKLVQPLVEEINKLEPRLRELSDDELRNITADLRDDLSKDATLEDVLPEAFAAVREAARRTIGMRHYDVQLIGGIILHRGKIAEMRTGEGKTLVATLPTYLNALTGKGVHVVTVNDYLARRDAQWMGKVYNALGMSVGVIQHEKAFVVDPTYQADEASTMGLRPAEHRRQAYAADITYGTNNEFGFDYLRDNMVWQMEDMVQRELHYAIVDEVDNILVDEARTPLIISGPADDASDDCRRFARLVRLMREGLDFEIEQRNRSITLNEEGIEKVERMLGIQNLYAAEHAEKTYYLENAMKAQFLFQRDVQYVVRGGEVIIVDEFTGRMMPGRRYSEGLHQAIEAKEGVPIQRENVTWARITFQNYFRLYDKLAGMTGTALTEADEFRRIYNLDVVPIPTHKDMVRKDLTDFVYKSEDGKFDAVVKDIEQLTQDGRPVLVGTVSIEKSEHLSKLLRARKIKHEVLNAKNHEREAAIIAQAGRFGAVTIATNMAGRGVDILLGGNAAGLADEILAKQKLDRLTATPEQLDAAVREAEAICAREREQVVDLGGLHVLGTERHEARRIDNQLRGRAGRQGDPGSSRFYLSLEDDLMKRFGGTRIAGLMGKMGLDDSIPLEHSLVHKAVASSQSKVEALNFDIRKHVVEYDDVMNRQREVIYADRRKALQDWSMGRTIDRWIGTELEPLVSEHLSGDDATAWDYAGLRTAIARIAWLRDAVDDTRLAPRSREEIVEDLAEAAREAAPNLASQIEAWISDELVPLVDQYLIDEEVNAWDHDALVEALAKISWVSDSVDAERLGTLSRQETIDDLAEAARRQSIRLHGQSEQWIESELQPLVDRFLPPDDPGAWDFTGLRAAVHEIAWLQDTLDDSRLQPRSREEIVVDLARVAQDQKPSPRQRIGTWLEEEVTRLVGECVAGDDPSRWDYEGILVALRRIPRLSDSTAVDALSELSRDELADYVDRLSQGLAREFPERIEADLRRLVDIYVPVDDVRAADYSGLLRALPHVPRLFERVVSDQLRGWPRQRIAEYLTHVAREIAAREGLAIVEWLDRQPEVLTRRYLASDDPSAWNLEGLETALQDLAWLDDDVIQKIQRAASREEVVEVLTSAANEHTRWLRQSIEEWIDTELNALMDEYLDGENPNEWRLTDFLAELNDVEWLAGEVDENTVRLRARDAVAEYAVRKAKDAYQGLTPQDATTVREWVTNDLKDPNPRKWQLHRIIDGLRRIPGVIEAITIDLLRQMSRDEIVSYLADAAREIMAWKTQSPEFWMRATFKPAFALHLRDEDPSTWRVEGLIPALAERPLLIDTIAVSHLERIAERDPNRPGGQHDRQEPRARLISYLVDVAGRTYDRWATELSPEQLRFLEQQWILPTIDRHWIRHLSAIDDMREGIGLRAYGQRDPLVEYKVEAAAMFDELLGKIRHDIVYAMSNLQVVTEPQPRRQPAAQPTAAATNRDEARGMQPVKAGKKLRPNDRCHCGSGAKYKRCHGRSER